MKKTKKLLAMLLAVSMIVVIMAATQVWAEETNTLVDISGTATMSTNGNDALWPVAGAVDGKYPAEENNWADGANDANGHWVSWLAGLWDAKDGQYIIRFNNENVVDGCNIAIILQYGHATRNGGWVEGRDYINPALRPIFDGLTEQAWKEVIG